MEDQPLMELFGFDETDLAANRKRKLTDKQEERLEREDRNIKNSFLYEGVLLLAGAAFLVFKSLEQGFLASSGSIFQAVIALLMGWTGIKMLLRDLKEFNIKLKKVEGPVQIKEMQTARGSRVYVNYQLMIGGVPFTTRYNAAEFMTDGDTYAIYYDEGSEREILSAEHISKKEA